MSDIAYSSGKKEDKREKKKKERRQERKKERRQCLQSTETFKTQ